MNLHRILDTLPAPQLTAAHWAPPAQSYVTGRHYALATPAKPLQMELQDQIVSLHYSDILKFFSTAEITAIARESLATMVANSLIACCHPYLLIEHYFPKSLTTRDIPKRLADTSGKFLTLSDLLTQMTLAHRKLEICVVGYPNKMLDLIDAMAMGHKCNIVRHKGIKLRDSNTGKKSYDNFTVHIIGSDFDSCNDVDSEDTRFDFVILMDSMADANNEWLQSHCNEHTVFIELLMANSVEHICHHFMGPSKAKLGLAGLGPHLSNIVAALVVLREKIGHIPSGLKPAYADDLAYLRPYIARPDIVPWSLPEMSGIGQYTSLDVERSLLREARFESTTDTGTEQAESSVTTGSAKGKFFDGRYYLQKRMSKKYLSNPLLGGYEHLTGISREVSGGEVLTHTLMFDYQSVLREWAQVQGDVLAFEQFDAVRTRHWQETKTELNKFQTLVAEKEAKLADINAQVASNESQCESLKLKTGQLQEQIMALTTDENLGAYAQRDVAKYDLLAQISRLETKLESAKNETKYMTEEIARADKSVGESQTNIEAYQGKQTELRAKITDLVATSTMPSNLAAKEALAVAERERAQLIAKVATILEDLNNPNVRHRAAPKRNFKK